MKNLILASVLLAASTLAHSQPENPQHPTTRRVIRPPQPAQPNAVAERSQILDRNVVIRLHGNISEAQEIDLSVTGAGPDFLVDQVVGDSVIACSYKVLPVDSGYQISYTIGCRVKVDLGQASSEYRDNATVGTAIFSPAKPLVVLKIGDRKLHLTISEVVDSE